MTNFSSKKVLLLKHFPYTQAAEHEVLPRLNASLMELGFTTHILELDEHLSEQQIMECEKDCLAVIDLHFQYPKFLDLTSFGMLWSPVSFMNDWGLGKSWSNQMSHDFLLVTGESETKEIAARYRTDDLDLLIVNHSVPGSWLVKPKDEYKNSKIRAFYAGIGWDRFNNRPGRHQEIFAYLDDKNMLDIYGPENIQGLKPWKGFSSYRGVIPFDGRSILDAASNAGAMLVFSSEAHKKANIMSNRFFEALASRCVVIGDDHSFIREVMGDKAFYLDLSKSPELIAQDLRSILEYLTENPHIVKELTDFGADLLLRNFDLTKQLESAIASFYPTKSDLSEYSAVVIGELNVDLQEQLENLGIYQVTFLANSPKDLPSLLALTKNVSDKNLVILTSDVTLMSNFSERLGVAYSSNPSKETTISILSGVCLKSKGQFEPRVIAKGTGIGQFKDMSSINGIILSPNAKISDWEKAEIDPVVCFRISEIAEKNHLQTGTDSSDILKRAISTGSKQQISVAVNNESLKHLTINEDSVLSLIVLSGKANRLRILFSLISAIPGIGVFKKMFRSFAIRLIEKNG